jgi:DNA-binding Xre family transcriptional regulator
MSDTIALVGELKAVLREQGLTYADLAPQLGLSEASVKRLFAANAFTLERFEAACLAAGIQVADLVERMAERKSPVTELTGEQEDELMANPKLLLMTYLMFNRWSRDDVLRVYELDPREVDALLLRLDALGIVDLRPGGRIRCLVTRNFAWRKDGPVQRFVERAIIPEFFQSRFEEPHAEFRFFASALSAASAEQLRLSIMRVVREFSELAEQDSALPMTERVGTAAVLAMRPMHFSGFARYKRDETLPPGAVPGLRRQR